MHKASFEAVHGTANMAKMQVRVCALMTACLYSQGALFGTEETDATRGLSGDICAPKCNGIFIRSWKTVLKFTSKKKI